MKKRLFSLLLCIIMIVGILPMNAFAKGKTEIKPQDTLLIFTKAQDATLVKEFFK